jgi:WhiB family redox-sensing transcriptional regulator
MFDTTDAACVNEDPNLFFPDGKTSYTVQVKQAKTICATCPIKMQCLAEALAETEFGIWGGTTEQERKYIRGKERAEILKHRR